MPVPKKRRPEKVGIKIFHMVQNNVRWLARREDAALVSVQLDHGGTSRELNNPFYARSALHQTNHFGSRGWCSYRRGIENHAAHDEGFAGLQSNALRFKGVQHMNWPVAWMMLSAALAAPGLSAQTYRIVDLGTFSQGVATVVRGPNGAGIASGSGNPSGPRRDGFGGRRGLVLEAGVTPSLVTGLAGSDDATVFAVNDTGTFVGSSNTAVAARAFTSSRKGAVSELPPLPGDVASAAYGLNNIGQAVGFSSGVSGERAVRWSARGAPEPLPTPGTPEASRAHAINERGDVVGSVSTGGGRRPVVWRSGQTASDLPPLGGFSSGEVYAVNAQGTAVGYSSNAAASRRATRWSATGAPFELGTLPGGNFSEAFGINDAGDVVGTSTSPGGGTRAVLWTRSGERVDLNTQVDAPTVVLTKATGINNRGMIVVVGHEPPAHSPAANAPLHDHDDTHDLPVRVFLLTRVGGPQ